MQLDVHPGRNARGGLVEPQRVHAQSLDRVVRHPSPALRLDVVLQHPVPAFALAQRGDAVGYERRART